MVRVWTEGERGGIKRWWAEEDGNGGEMREEDDPGGVAGGVRVYIECICDETKRFAYT
jgi:hypothetical protein